jgi:hypothetical protein
MDLCRKCDNLIKKGGFWVGAGESVTGCFNYSCSRGLHPNKMLWCKSFVPKQRKWWQFWRAR